MAKIPISPSKKISNGCVCTPDGGFLYIGTRSINFVGNMKKCDSGVRLRPEIKAFYTLTSIKAIDVDPNWRRSNSNVGIEAKVPGADRKYFAVLMKDNSLQIWDFDRECAIIGHRAHFKSIVHMEGKDSPSVNDYVLLSYMCSGNVLTMDRQGLIVYDTASNTYSRNATLHDTQHQTMTILRCSPYNEYIFAVGTEQGMIIIGDIQKMTVVYTLSGHNTAVTSLSWCPKNEDPISLTLQKSLDGNAEINECITYESVGEIDILLASASLDSDIWIWNTETGVACDNVRPSNSSELTEDKKNFVVWLSSSQFLTCNKAGELAYWSIIFEKGASRRYKIQENKQRTFQISDVVHFNIARKVGLLWCISSQREISCEHLETGELLMKCGCASTDVAVMQECPANMNRIALGLSDKRVGIIDVSNLSATAVHIENFEKHIHSAVVSLAWSPSCNRLAFGTVRGMVGIINVKSKKCVKLEPISDKAVYSMDWQKGQIFVVSNGILGVYDDKCKIKAARIIKEVKNASFVSVRFGRLLVGTQQGRLQVYHLKDVPENSYKLVQNIEISYQYIADIAWCPMNSKIAVVANNIHIFEFVPEHGTVSLIAKTTTKNDEAANFCAKWSSEEPFKLLTCGSDGAVRVWDFDSKKITENYFKQFQCPMKSGLFLPTNELMCAGTSTSIELIDMREKEQTGSTGNRGNRVKWAFLAQLVDKNKLQQTQNVASVPKQTQADLFTLIAKGSNEVLVAEIKAIAEGPIEKQLLISKLFGSKSQAVELLNTEVSQYKPSETAGRPMVYMQAISKAEIIRCIQENKLEAWHVALAPTISFKYWQKCSAAFAEQLLDQGYPLQAASYKIAISSPIKAMEMLASNHFYRESLLIGRVHLEPVHIVMNSIIDRWILHLCKTGNYYGAALICVMTEQFARAIEILNGLPTTTPQIAEVIRLLKGKMLK